MSKFMEVSLGVCIMLIGVGLLTYVAKGGSPVFLIAIIAILVGGLTKFRRQGLKEAGGESKGRLDGLEQRMNDLQDIVIGMDDKLSRLAKKVTSTATEGQVQDDSGPEKGTDS